MDVDGLLFLVSNVEDTKVRIEDVENGETKFVGSVEDARDSEFCFDEVQSIDIENGVLVINID